MRIMIDGMNLALEQGTGVATYGRNLSFCLKRLGHDVTALYGKPAPRRGDAVMREAMFMDEPEEKFDTLRWAANILGGVVPNAHPAVVPDTGLVDRRHGAHLMPRCDRFLNYWDLFRVAYRRFQITGLFMDVTLPVEVDIAHWTYPIPIRARGVPNVYTLHDLVPLKLPYATLDDKRRYYRMVKRIAEESAHIMTVSERSRTDIIEMLPAPPEKVTNTYQSVAIPRGLLEKSEADIDIELAHAFHAPMGDAAHSSPDDVGGLRRGGFYLFVGAIEPKKNLRRIIEGYLASGVPEPLIVVGRKAWQFKREINMMTRSPRIIYLDYLPFGQLVTLMRAARALVWPSLYEGFGLPILEAFICGAPVITAKGSSTGEIAGDAALLVDPYDAGAIRDAIRRLSGPGSDALRAEMIEKGRRRAAEFDEATIAPRVEACYRRVLGG